MQKLRSREMPLKILFKGGAIKNTQFLFIEGMSVLQFKQQLIRENQLIASPKDLMVFGDHETPGSDMYLGDEHILTENHVMNLTWMVVYVKMN
jgi:hypothetical protein